MTSDTINYRQVIAHALADALEADPDVLLLGEDVGAAGGAFKTTAGLFDRFGPRRVRDTPISEQAIVGAAIGAAMTGLRPVAEIMFADFAGVCFDQIANQLAKLRYMSGGQARLPVVIRMANGAGGGFAAQHSQATENWFLNVPGLKIVAPGTVRDLYGLLRTAIEDDNPVLVFEHKSLFSIRETVPHSRVPIGVADVARRGTDLTLVALQQMRYVALEAADQLATEGIEVEVIDPRSLVPFDDATVVESLARTSRLLVVQEAPPGGSWGASLVARIAQQHFTLLDAPPVLLAADETPVPFSAPLEAAWMPDAGRVRHAARELVAW